MSGQSFLEYSYRALRLVHKQAFQSELKDSYLVLYRR